MSTPFKSPEEAAEAAKLGFKAPTQPKEEALPKTTKVVGYFNPNAWPISISISTLGISVTLEQSGDYVMMQTEKGLVKVNDPILEEYVRARGLAREVTDTPVPVVAFPRTAPRYGDPTTSVSSAEKFEKGPDGRTQAVARPMVTLSPDLPPPGRSPVVGMTRAEAEAAGLIKPTAPVKLGTKDEGRPVTDGASLPEIEYARDLTPGQVKKLKAAEQDGKLPEGTAELLSTEDAARRRQLIESMNKASTAPVEGSVEELAKASAEEILAQPDEPVIPPLPPAPTTQPTQPASGLPQPTGFEEPESQPEEPVTIEEETQVGDVEEQSHPTPPPPPPAAPKIVAAQSPTPVQQTNQAGMKFKCPACDSGYPFRSGLERHAQTKHPDQVEAIMAQYPKKQ